MKMWTPAVAVAPQQGEPVWISSDTYGTVAIATWQGKCWYVLQSSCCHGAWIETFDAADVTFWMPMDWPEFREQQ